MSNLMVLVIEDNFDIAEVFRMAFQKAGYQVEVARDGQRALDLLAEIEPDVIVLDLRLPYVSGPEVLRYIHQETRLVNTYIIVTSADPRLAASFHDQANMVLIKPVTYSQLRDVVASLTPNNPK
jgi:two-component system alkaline phosphatase synthesis response regulator PhoP